MNRLWLGLGLLLGVIGITGAQQISMPPPAGVIGIACAYNASPSTLTTSNPGWVQCDSQGRLLTASAVSVGGATPFHLVAAATNNATSLKATAGTVYSIQLGGIGSAPAYLKLYDKASAPTCQSDAVVSQFIIPAASTTANGGGSNSSVSVGKAFTSGIAFCVVTGIADNDNTAVAAATFIINIDYK